MFVNYQNKIIIKFQLFESSSNFEMGHSAQYLIPIQGSIQTIFFGGASQFSFSKNKFYLILVILLMDNFVIRKPNAIPEPESSIPVSNINNVEPNDPANNTFRLETIRKLIPCQPDANYIFPTTNGRGMSVFHYQEYPFITYSKSTNKVFCFYCLYL